MNSLYNQLQGNLFHMITNVLLMPEIENHSTIWLFFPLLNGDDNPRIMKTGIVFCCGLVPVSFTRIPQDYITDTGISKSYVYRKPVK